jgi:hypothetical protein
VVEVEGRGKEGDMRDVDTGVFVEGEEAKVDGPAISSYEGRSLLASPLEPTTEL